jgi:hypothetical protein
LLADAGIGINDEVNGVLLAANKTVHNPDGTSVHSVVHTEKYFLEVERRLEKAAKVGGVREALREIAIELSEDTFPYK